MSIRFVAFLIFAASLTACDQTPKMQYPIEVVNPYPDAAELRLFVVLEHPELGGEAVLSHPNGVLLSVEERRQFEDSLVIEAAPEAIADCFIPHHFFKYYSAEGEQIGEVQVCFCCGGVEATGSELLESNLDQIVSADYSALAVLIESLGEPTDAMCE